MAIWKKGFVYKMQISLENCVHLHFFFFLDGKNRQIESLQCFLLLFCKNMFSRFNSHSAILRKYQNKQNTHAFLQYKSIKIRKFTFTRKRTPLSNNEPRTQLKLIIRSPPQRHLYMYNIPSQSINSIQ